MTECRTRVIVRVRPQQGSSPPNKLKQAACIASCGPDSLHYQAPDGQCSKFTFDRVHDEVSCQMDVYRDLKDIVPAIVDGTNASILSYGQTGSGKTHTLIGNMKNSVDKGLVPRAAQQLCQAAQEPPSGCIIELSISVVEIYCERIRDLLQPESNSTLNVTQDKVRGCFIAGALEAKVENEQELLDTMRSGFCNRAVASTSMNATSSRSHCIVNLFVTRRWTLTEDVQHSKLCLVDLAGSERAEKTHAAAQTLDEGKLINKSLSALGNVVNALTQGKAGGHVPFRDSKLTRALQDSIGGNAITTLIICCSPCMDNATESLSSLRFGTRATGIASVVDLSPAKDVQHKKDMLENVIQQLAASKADCLKWQTDAAHMRQQLDLARQVNAQGGQGAEAKPESRSAGASSMSGIADLSKAHTAAANTYSTAPGNTNSVAVVILIRAAQLVCMALWVMFELLK